MLLANTPPSILRQCLNVLSKPFTYSFTNTFLRYQRRTHIQHQDFRPRSHIKHNLPPYYTANYSTNNNLNLKWPTRSKFKSLSAGELRDRKRIKELRIDNIHDNLLQLALTGDYTRTKSSIDTLLEERDEKPAPQVYEALLLANVDSENGSASEAASILEEMTDEGIVPDASVFHACLRVGYVL